MSRQVEPSRRETAIAADPAVDDERELDPDLPPVLSVRRPALRKNGVEEQVANEDQAPDTIPAPMWFVEE